MISDVKEIHQLLNEMLKAHCPPLQIRIAEENNFEVAGTKEVMQGRKKVDGMFFANTVPKPKDVRLYFFPIYTHPQAFELSEELSKCLKGKSCFHIKKMSEALVQEIEQMIQTGVNVYQQHDLI